VSVDRTANAEWFTMDPGTTAEREARRAAVVILYSSIPGGDAEPYDGAAVTS
jgi:hypothetical protein